MMVDVVTGKTAAENAVNEDEIAAEEMAAKAQEVAEQDTTEEPSEEIAEKQDWDDLLVDEEAEESAEADEEVITPEEVEEEVVVETPEETEEVIKPEETPPVEEATTEEVPETPEEKTRTPEEVQQELSEARKTARDKLVDSFKMTEEQIDLFEEDPGAALPPMMADLFLNLYDSISQGLRGQMPNMVQRMMAEQVATQEGEKQFFSAWPQLAKGEYRETVDRIANAYRQQNPTTDNATAVKEIGAQAWVALRLPLDELMAHTTDIPASVAPVVARQAHVPANAGNVPASARVPVQGAKNEFEQLADELLIDDND